MVGAVRVVAAVIKRHDNYLICKRPIKKRHGGFWEFPGGKINEGESLESATKRELAEELNLHLTSIGETLYVGSDPGSPFRIEFVEAHVEGEPHPIEHEDLCWVSLSRLDDFELAPVDHLFVRHLSNMEIISDG